MSLGSSTKTLASRLRGTTYAAMEAAADLCQDKRPCPKLKGEYVPVYVALGLIVFSLSLGLHTAKQQLMHSPAVRVKKSRRETVPEVTDPDRVAEESENFLAKGFFRRVAHVQDTNTVEHAVPDIIRKDAYTHRPRVETLKSVGVDPKTA